ncbi:MAG: hypothetical protein OEY52_10445 [Gammaproteobacteria bacterium]|nr:hypothetical protein [Gammaproteobacteria bacterium]
MRYLFLALLLIIPVQSSSAEFDIQSYQQVKFADIKTAHTGDLLKSSQKNGTIVSTATFKYVFPVKFIKKLRKLSILNKTVIQAWQDALRVPPDFINLYQNEFKVVLGNDTYWIPVQEHLLLPMSSELHAGDQFDLFVIVIGAKDGKLVMLATEFRSDRAPN